MARSTQYYPNDLTYFPNPFNIYANILTLGDCPDPCRKYHISSDIRSAKTVADAVLQLLRVHRIYHKVVKNEELLTSQTEGKQAGKFITLYMEPSVDQWNHAISAIAEKLGELKRSQGIRPCDSIPRSRRFRHLFIEQPLDDNMFIYGGYVTGAND